MSAINEPLSEAIGGLMPSTLSTREAAIVLGVSETTLRRSLRTARGFGRPGASDIRGYCRGIPFTAVRVPRGNRYAWRFVLRSPWASEEEPATHRERGRIIPFATGLGRKLRRRLPFGS